MNLVDQKATELAAKLSVNEMALNDIDEQIKTLQAKKKRLTSSLEEFKDDLREAMSNSGVTRIENDEYGILFRLDPPSSRVEIDDESAIPEKFLKTKIEVNKTAIKQALKVGDDVPGAKLTEGKHRLIVRA